MRKNILIMNVLVACFWMSMYSYVPNLPEYAVSLGADAVVLGIIGGVYGIAQVLLRIPIGVLSDKTGKNRLMLVIGSGVLAVSCAMLIFAHNTDMIISGRLIAGAAAAWWVILSATYADYHEEAMQVKAQGVLGASASWGKVVAAGIGGLMAQFIGVHSIFIFAFCVAVLCIILSAQLTDLPKKPKVSVRDLLPLFKNRNLLMLCLMGIFMQLICFAIATLFTATAAKELGATSFDLGMLNLLFFASAGLFSLFVGTKLYKKIGGLNALAAAFLIGAVSCIPFFYHSGLPAIYIMQLLAGVCYGVTGSALAGMVVRCVPLEQRGMATGIFQSSYGIGIFGWPVMAGYITKAASFDEAYWTSAAVLVAAAVLCYVLIPKKFGEM